MYNRPPWVGLRKVYTAKKTTLDAGKVGVFVNDLGKHLSAKLTADLQLAILNGPIGTEAEVTKGDYRGTFVNRVQSFLWKNEGIQFEAKNNVLNDALTRATKCSIPHDLYARWDESFNWTAGDFGDARSCFFGGHAKTRYHLKHWKPAIALQFYSLIEETGKGITEKAYHKSPLCEGGKWYQGFGRCWATLDWPNDGLIVVWNSYPANENLTAFAAGVIEGLSHDDKKLASTLTYKTNSLVNSGQNGGWFYTNNGCIVIGTQDQLKKVEKGLDIHTPEPKHSSFEEHGGQCAKCGLHVWTDRPSVYEKSKTVSISLCETCVAQKPGDYFVSCGLCSSTTFFHGSGKYETLSVSAKVVTNKETKKTIICCPTCHSNLDLETYSTKFEDQVKPKTPLPKTSKVAKATKKVKEAVGATVQNLQLFQEQNEWDEDEGIYVGAAVDNFDNEEYDDDYDDDGDDDMDDGW
jgi:hypothetical protein